MISTGDSLTILKTMEDESINCVITSPPYWSLRDYGCDGQLGQEDTFEEYVEKLCVVFDEVKRVLRKDGTCFVNLGDTYGGTKIENTETQKNPNVVSDNFIKHSSSLPDKCLLQIPSRFAIAMCDRGWILRNECIWHKPNAMPSSVTDRFTVDYEKVFFFVKSKRYAFEQQFEPYTEPMNRWGGEKLKAHGDSGWDKGTGQSSYRDRDMRPNPEGRNMRTVWSIPTKPYTGAHFAVFPEALVEPILKAGCPEGQLVLDPFAGAGTVGVVAKRLKREFIGIELRSEYVEMAKERIENTPNKLL